jgi:hypothetical protein
MDKLMCGFLVFVFLSHDGIATDILDFISWASIVHTLGLILRYLLLLFQGIAKSTDPF